MHAALHAALHTQHWRPGGLRTAHCVGANRRSNVRWCQALGEYPVEARSRGSPAARLSVVVMLLWGQIAVVESVQHTQVHIPLPGASAAARWEMMPPSMAFCSTQRRASEERARW